MKKFFNNSAYVYVLLVSLSVLMNLIFEYESNVLLVTIGLGFFNIIYILDKILKK